MASTPRAHLVRQNFAWRIAAITPTATDGNPRTAYREIDPTRIDPEQTSGLTRTFSITWLGSEEDHQIDGAGVSDDLSRRPARHTYQLAVYYAVDKLGYSTVQDLLLQDRHDITKALRNPDNFVGYNDDNTSTSLGIYNRVRESDELDQEENTVWAWRSTWRVHIEELEQ